MHKKVNYRKTNKRKSTKQKLISKSINKPNKRKSTKQKLNVIYKFRIKTKSSNNLEKIQKVLDKALKEQNIKK